jgi:hypothetical protein
MGHVRPRGQGLRLHALPWCTFMRATIRSGMPVSAYTSTCPCDDPRPASTYLCRIVQREARGPLPDVDLRYHRRVRAPRCAGCIAQACARCSRRVLALPLGGAPHDARESQFQEHRWPDCRSCASADTSPAALTSAVTCAPRPPRLLACLAGAEQACTPSPCSVPVEHSAAPGSPRLRACPVSTDQACMPNPCRVPVEQSAAHHGQRLRALLG